MIFMMMEQNNEKTQSEGIIDSFITMSTSSTTKPSATEPSSSSSTEPNIYQPQSSSNVADSRYTFDEAKLDELRKESPWKNDPKFFKQVSVSPTAIVKMMTHCNSGVEKGIKKGGNPIEVMGLILGRPDPQTPNNLIVTDVFPLPIEGFETRVVADDQDVVNHMIALSDSLENTRKERFMGWYHSHPFDLGDHSHCFLSQTDLTTQLQWQRAEDPHGNPFLAMVIDPLRSVAKDVPEIKAFRAYPPDYNSPTLNECPDGSIIGEEKVRLEKWGSCWSRYYELGVDYFMSRSARNVMAIMTQNLWMRNLGTTNSLQVENQEAYPETLKEAKEKFRDVDVKGFTAGMQNLGALAAAGTGSNNGENNESVLAKRREVEKIAKACDGVVDLATEKIREGITQAVKKDMFAS